jgi:hypothetical protein
LSITSNSRITAAVVPTLVTAALVAACGRSSTPSTTVTQPPATATTSAPTTAGTLMPTPGLTVGPCLNGLGRTPPAVATLKANLGALPQPPSGATLTATASYNGEEHGPSIEACYHYVGTASSFVGHYSETLPKAGWTEVRAGNLPGQLANFEKRVNGEGLLLVVFHQGGAAFTVDFMTLTGDISG